MRHRAFLFAALILTGCPMTIPPADAGPAISPDAGPPVGDAGPGDAGPPPPRPDALDLLFVVDNSNSMTEEQAGLTDELPRMMRAVTTGDLDLDGTPESTPFTSVQVGVVTTDMGTGGFTVPTCRNSAFGDDGILRTAGRTGIPGCMATYPSFLAFGAGASPDAFANDVACVATAGTGGCGYEQQLEASLKALSPTSPQTWTAPGYEAPRFFMNSEGNADVENNGFVRDDTLLAIVLLTDEEDCSASDPEIYNPTSATYTSDLSLRCFTYSNVALHPVSRYVDGLIQLRTSPNHLVLFPIAGVPTDLQTMPGAATNWGPITSDDPAVRDDRLEERVDPANPTRLMPSCNEPGSGLAFPPTRIARVAQQLGTRGARTGIGSICSSFLSTPIETFLRLLQ